MHLTDALNA